MDGDVQDDRLCSKHANWAEDGVSGLAGRLFDLSILCTLLPSESLLGRSHFDLSKVAWWDHSSQKGALLEMAKLDTSTARSSSMPATLTWFR